MKTQVRRKVLLRHMQAILSCNYTITVVTFCQQSIGIRQVLAVCLTVVRHSSVAPFGLQISDCTRESRLSVYGN